MDSRGFVALELSGSHRWRLGAATESSCRLHRPAASTEVWTQPNIAKLRARVQLHGKGLEELKSAVQEYYLCQGARKLQRLYCASLIATMKLAALLLAASAAARADLQQTLVNL